MDEINKLLQAVVLLGSLGLLTHTLGNIPVFDSTLSMAKGWLNLPELSADQPAPDGAPGGAGLPPQAPAAPNAPRLTPESLLAPRTMPSAPNPALPPVAPVAPAPGGGSGVRPEDLLRPRSLPIPGYDPRRLQPRLQQPVPRPYSPPLSPGRTANTQALRLEQAP